MTGDAGSQGDERRRSLQGAPKCRDARMSDDRSFGKTRLVMRARSAGRDRS